MKRHMLSKERSLEIDEFMMTSDGFMTNYLRIPRRYHSAFMECTWHVCRVKGFLEIKYTLLFLLIFSSRSSHRYKAKYEMGEEPRKKEPNSCKEWKVNSDVWDILQKGKVTMYIENLALH